MNAAKYLVGDNLHAMQKSNIHVHFLNGSVPKDGPSAGTAICTALISLVSGKAIPSDLSMTGEISLNGNVCKIGKFFGKMVGGIQQKLIAAKTLGIKDVFIPKGNLGDVLDLPHMLLHGLNLFFVERYEQIYGLIFEDRLALFKAGEKLTDPDIVVVKDGYIVTQTQNSIYKNYELNES
jgi:ATP-dependent Lon protease